MTIPIQPDSTRDADPRTIPTTEPEITREETTLQSSIRPGEIWRDTYGEPIQAHGGSVLEDGGRFYWYGENKERSKPGNGIWHWGVRCYVSDDLYNWTDLGVIIPPVEDDPDSPLHPSQQMDRPHIIRDDRHGTYVCWMKVMGPEYQESTILVSDSLTGPYKIIRSGLRPLGMSAGDFDLVIDPDDGRGYYYFERVHSDLIVADLTDDYTDVTGHFSAHFEHDSPPDVREAPAYFRRADKHYLLTSGTSWYFPNPSEVAVADTHHGPWTVLEDPHPTDETRTSFRTQISSVFKHPSKEDLYIAIGDRWLPDTPAETAHEAADLFQRMFAGDEKARIQVDQVIANTSSVANARYVWLPIRFHDGQPSIEWHDEWRIEDF